MSNTTTRQEVARLTDLRDWCKVNTPDDVRRIMNLNGSIHKLSATTAPAATS